VEGVRDSQAEEKPAQVPARAKQAGEPRASWSWVEPSVWTERMLAALEAGVKGGKWFSLIDKVYSLRNLRQAFTEVKSNRGGPGVDGVTIRRFEAHLEENLERLSNALREGTYQPQPVRRAWTDKPGSRDKRPLGIPTVRDRVVQAALRHVLEPIFERDFAAQSYGFRPKRSAKDALRRVDALLKAGYVVVVDADLQSYYDTIPRQPLLELVGHKVADMKVLDLVAAYLEQEVMEGTQHWSPERGTPQGAVISPLLSNIYLDPLDHHMAQLGYEMVRYADDFVILCRSQLEADRALAEVAFWVSAAGLRLHPDKTRTVEATQRGGFDFLGYHFERGYRWPSKKSLRKFKDKIRVKTKRTSGHSLQRIIAELTPILKGWFEYFKHSGRIWFGGLDKWIRMRLRSILRRRQGRRGRALGLDHHRWPNAFFAEQGLFSLVAAYAQIRQSSRR
jgi:RNA-directed DNA polymerase